MDTMTLLSFIWLLLGGHIGIPAVLLTFACSRTVTPRSVALINFLVCIVIFATSFLILFYSDEISSDEPSFIFCRLQSALVHASGPLVTAAGVALVAETLEHVSHTEDGVKCARWKVVVMVAIPWIIFLAFFLAFFISGLAISTETESWAVRAPFFYCRFPNGPLLNLSYAVVIAGLACIIVTEVFIGLRLKNHASQSQAKGIVLPVPFWHLLLPGLIFSVYCFIAACVVYFLSNFGATESAYTVISLIPLMAFVLFGTQRDVMRVWFFHSPIFDPPPIDVDTEFGMPRYLPPTSGRVKEVSNIIMSV